MKKDILATHCLSAFIVAFVIVLLFMSGTQAQQGQDSDQPKPQIVFLDELVQTMNDAEWRDQTKEAIQPNQRRSQGSEIARGIMDGMILSENESLNSVPEESKEHCKIPVVDVTLKPAVNTLRNEARGLYSFTLPNLKLIQLEVDYDVILNNPDDNELAEFYVEVFERDPERSDEWVLTGELHQRERIRNDQSKQIYSLVDESGTKTEDFISRSFNVDLSKWAGKEVKLALAASAPRIGERVYKGRWVKARLVGANFSYAIASN